MEIKKCLNSEVPTPSNGTGYFYLDQETNKLKLKKSTETVSWDLVGVDKYKDVDAETARLCHILENDDTEGYEAKVLYQLTTKCKSFPLDEVQYDEEPCRPYDAIKTSDGYFYTKDSPETVHTFNTDSTDNYIIVYFKTKSPDRVYYGGADYDSIPLILQYFDQRIVYDNFKFNKIPARSVWVGWSNMWI